MAVAVTVSVQRDNAAEAMAIAIGDNNYELHRCVQRALPLTSNLQLYDISDVIDIETTRTVQLRLRHVSSTNHAADEQQFNSRLYISLSRH